MSTALTTAPVSFASLVPGSRQMAIIKANMDGEPISEQDLTKVRTPAGGGTTWEIDNQGNTVAVQEIVGVLVAIGKRGLLWPFQEIGKDPPVLATTDLITGYRTSDKLGDVSAADLEKYRIGDKRYNWEALSNGPEFGPKSGKGGVGKRVKESRTIAILRDGDVWPLLISIGPGSLGNFLPFLKKLPCFHYEAVVGLKLAKAQSKTDVTYSEIVPRLVGTLSEEQGEFVRDTYTVPVKKMFDALPFGAVAGNIVDEGSGDEGSDDETEA